MKLKSGIYCDIKNIGELAQKLGPRISGGEIFALFGDLGSGKTAFVKLAAKALSVKKNVSSPTFTLLNSYEGRLKNGNAIRVFHADLYRLPGHKEALALGFEEFWKLPDSVTFIEWPGILGKKLPKNAIKIFLKNAVNPKKITRKNPRELF